jgi:hypothetical protein
VTDAGVLAVLDRADPFSAVAEESPFDAADLDELAAIPDAEQTLVELAGDAAATTARRYAAAQALLCGPFETWRSSPAGQTQVAAALGAGLRDDRTHNRWGLPGHFTGRPGDELLSLEHGVEDALAPLLDDDRRLQIIGSEEATLADDAGFRIADLAAYLLSSYRGTDWAAPASTRKRDKDIKRLKSSLVAP